MSLAKNNKDASVAMAWQERLLWGLSKILSQLSTKTICRLARLLSFLSFDCLRLRRKVILKNLEIAFGNSKSASEKKQIAKESVYNFILTAFEFIRSPYHPISEKIHFENKHLVDEALAQGNGLYMLCMHMGNWEAHSPAISKNICPVYLAVKKVGSAPVNRFVEDLRENNHFLWIKRKRKGDAYKAILKILDRNEIAGFVFDQARPGEPRLPFFGKEAKTNTSFAAIRKNAQHLLFYFCRKNFFWGTYG